MPSPASLPSLEPIGPIPLLLRLPHPGIPGSPASGSLPCLPSCCSVLATAVHGTKPCLATSTTSSSPPSPASSLRPTCRSAWPPGASTSSVRARAGSPPSPGATREGLTRLFSPLGHRAQPPAVPHLRRGGHPLPAGSRPVGLAPAPGLAERPRAGGRLHAHLCHPGHGRAGEPGPDRHLHGRPAALVGFQADPAEQPRRGGVAQGAVTGLADWDAGEAAAVAAFLAPRSPPSHLGLVCPARALDISNAACLGGFPVPWLLRLTLEKLCLERGRYDGQRLHPEPGSFGRNCLPRPFASGSKRRPPRAREGVGTDAVGEPALRGKPGLGAGQQLLHAESPGFKS